MKKLFIMVTALSLFSCKKTETDKPYCSQCRQFVLDSLTRDTIEIKTGSPDKSAMYYCNGALREIKSQPPVYFHNVVYYENHGETDTSHCQKYVYSCPN